MNTGRALTLLGAALQGRIEPGTDWLMLIELANRAMVTPSLFAALKDRGALRAAPDDAVSFMAEVTSRSAARNLRLLATANDAIAALNAVGIRPVLLKGLALWASLPDPAPFSRLMSDVDLMVRPDEAEAAVSALQEAGFGIVARHDGPATHVAAELGRPDDVGLVDLHRRPPGPPGLARPFEPERHAALREWRGGVYVPSPASQTYLTCLHDQFHDGGYWRGGFDLRHLHDIAELTRLAGGIDWAMLDAMMPTRLVRNAVHAELIAAHEIAGADVPDDILERPIARLQYRRHRAQHLHPRWGLPLAAVGFALESANIAQHRAINRAAWAELSASEGAALDDRWGYRPSRIRGFMKMRGGKI